MSIGAITPGDDAMSAAIRSAEKTMDRTGDDTQTAQPSSSGAYEERSRLASRLLQLSQTSLQISKHPESGMVMVRVIDQNTGQVVRETPPEEVLDCVSYLLAQAGLIFDQSA